MKKFFSDVFIALISSAVTAATVIFCVGIFAGNFFVDMTFKRGSMGDPSAPPAIFRILLEGIGKSAYRPKLPTGVAEDWEMKSFDGLRLSGTHFAPEGESGRFVILVHGYGMDRTHTYNYAREYLARGWHVLAPDMRASGTSGGEYVTMGALESRDLADWSRLISARFPDAKIALHGVSMGAAAALIASARDDLSPAVFAVISDSSYSDLHEIFSREIGRLTELPPEAAVMAMDFVCKRRAGFTLAEASPALAVGSSRVPTLFIHGDADRLVPYDMARELLGRSRAPGKEFFTAKGFAHSAAYRDPKYFETVFAFLKTYLEENVNTN